LEAHPAQDIVGDNGEIRKEVGVGGLERNRQVNRQQPKEKKPI